MTLLPVRYLEDARVMYGQVLHFLTMSLITSVKYAYNRTVRSVYRLK